MSPFLLFSLNANAFQYSIKSNKTETVMFLQKNKQKDTN